MTDIPTSVPPGAAVPNPNMPPGTMGAPPDPNAVAGQQAALLANTGTLSGSPEDTMATLMAWKVQAASAAGASSTNPANSLSPEAAAPIGQASQSVGDAAQAGAATAGFSNATSQRQALEAQGASVQLGIWNGLTKPEQNQLMAAGYRPPHKNSGGIGGLLHRAVVDVGRGLGTAAGDVGGFLKDVASGALHTMGTPLRLDQHILRTAEQTMLASLPVASQTRPGSPNGWGGGGPNLGDWAKVNWGVVFSPSEWEKAWNETENGDKYFLPYVKREVEQKYGQDTADLAERIASGAKLTDLVKSVPASQQPAFAQRIQTDPNVKQAVTMLQNGKVSLGRLVVGEPYMTKNPEAGTIMSGGIDAIFDWFGDPLNAGLKSTKAFNEGRYVVRSGADVMNAFNNVATVRKGMANIAQHVANHNVPALVQLHLAPIAAQMINEGADTPEKVAAFFASKIDTVATMQGGIAADGTMLPHLSRAGQARLFAMGELQKPIDWLADTPARINGVQAGDLAQNSITGLHPLAAIETGTGRLTRAFTTLLPEGKDFDPMAPDALVQFQRLCLTFLSRADTNDLVTKFALAPTVGEKRDIYRGVLTKLGDAAHLTDDPEAAKTYRDMVAKIGAPGHYASDGVDNFNGHPAGILEQDIGNWGMPDFKQLYAASKKMSITRSVFGVINNPAADWFMQQAWKPLTLLRLGFPIRAGGEELLAAMLRDGPKGLMQSRLALSALKDPTEPITAWHPLTAMWHNLAGHLPAKVVDTIDTPSEFMSQHFADNARAAFRGVEGTLSGKYLDYAKELATGGYWDQPMLDKINALHGRGAGYLDEPTTWKQIYREGKLRSMSMSYTGKYRDVANTEELFHNVWSSELNRLTQSTWARTAMINKDLPVTDRINAVADSIQANPNQWKKFERSIGTSDGRLVDAGEVTQRQSAEDHAIAVINKVDQLTHSANGEEIPGLVDHLIDNRIAPTPRALAEIEPRMLPKSVMGPEVVPVPASAVHSIIQHGFDQVVGRPMNWMIRQPLFLENYAQSRELMNGLAEQLAARYGENANLDQIKRDLAVERAVNATIPFIHNPDVKSQFATVTRNLAPFWFAQEQFYKRWAKEFAYAPWAFRQAQMLVGGIRHAGILHKDPNTGQEYFLYPGSGVIQDTLAQAFQAITGKPFTLPIQANLRGQIQFISPGTERLGLPSFGPLMAIPVDLVAKRFPELNQAQQQILGQRGAAPSLWEQIVPTTLARFVHVAIDSPDRSPQMASAMMQAMQYLDATGQMFPKGVSPDSATPDQLDQAIARVQNWTRVLFFTRMVFGYGVPASPELQINPDNMNEQLSQLIAAEGIDNAIKTFISEHPDASAYTVFQSSSKSGAPLPSTQGALDFMDSNAQFLKDYPYAGAWFIPQTDSTGQFSQAAYRTQLAEQLRIRKDPKTFYHDIVYARDADAYFAAEDRKNTALRNVHGSQATLIRQAWSDQSQEYLKMHPIFADMLQSSDAKFRRTQALTELTTALSDSRTPTGTQTDHIRTLINGYNAYQAMYSQFNGLRTTAATSARRNLEVEFARQITAYVNDPNNADVQGLYNRLIRPDLTNAIAAMEKATGVPAPTAA